MLPISAALFVGLVFYHSPLSSSLFPASEGKSMSGILFQLEHTYVQVADIDRLTPSEKERGKEGKGEREREMERGEGGRDQKRERGREMEGGGGGRDQKREGERNILHIGEETVE